MTRAFRLLLVSVIVGVALVFAGGSAAFACDPGLPVPPLNDGIQPPAPANPPTDPQAPFTDPRVPIADVYGYNWSKGCQPGFLKNPIAATSNSYAGDVFDMNSRWLSLLGSLEKLAHATGIDWATDMVVRVAEGVRPIIFGGTTGTGIVVGAGLLMLAFLASALIIWFRARKMTAADTATTAAVAMVALAVATLAAFAPAAVSTGVDSVAKQAGAIAGSSFNSSLVDGAHRQAQYRPWLGSMFGDPDSAAAKKWGPQLKEATTYTWDEWAQVEAGNGKDINDRKKDLFEEVLNDVEANHPEAAKYLKGEETRSGWSQTAVFMTALMGVFALLSFLIVTMARILLQVLVLAAPFAAIAGILPKGGVVMMRMAGQAGAYIWAIFKFTLAAAIMGLVLGGLSTIHPNWGPVWMIIATVVGLVFLKPFRAFKNLSPTAPVNKSMFGKLFGLLTKIVALLSGSAVAGAVAGVAGASVQNAARPAPDPQSAPDAGMVQAQLSVPTPPPLERVHFQQIPGTNQHRPLPPPPVPGGGLPSGGGPPRQPLAPGGGAVAPTVVQPASESAPVTVHRDSPDGVVISGTVVSVEDKLFRAPTTAAGEVVPVQDMPAVTTTRPEENRRQDLELFVPA